MNPSELIELLETQIEARGLEPLSGEQIELLESEDSAERDALLEELRDEGGFEIPADAFSCVDDDERSNGPRG